VNWAEHPKLTPRQREEIVTIALMRRGPYCAYPVRYIAALYGVSHVYVLKLVHATGKYRKGMSATMSVNRMGLRT